MQRYRSLITKAKHWLKPIDLFTVTEYNDFNIIFEKWLLWDESSFVKMLFSEMSWLQMSSFTSTSLSLGISVTRRKSPNVYKSCTKMISLEKWNILTYLQNSPKNVGDLVKLIVAKGFKKLTKVQKIAKSGHTARNRPVRWQKGSNGFSRYLFASIFRPALMIQEFLK